MRLIDADSLSKKIDCPGVPLVYWYDIEAESTVDAVPVVRCKDCVYWKEPWDGSANPFGKCRRNDMTMAGSGFCSYGERKNDV